MNKVNEQIRFLEVEGTPLANGTFEIFDTQKTCQIAADGLEQPVRITVENSTSASVQFDIGQESWNLYFTITENGHFYANIPIAKNCWIKIIIDDENSVCKKVVCAIYDKGDE